jgi:regulator of nonsense transcripts 2
MWCGKLTSTQAKTVALPSNSSFAVAMRHQQQAEREEQQRIKNLVLNYDLGEDEDDGTNDGGSIFASERFMMLTLYAGEKHGFGGRYDRSGRGGRGGQRSRKLQMSDVDW